MRINPQASARDGLPTPATGQLMEQVSANYSDWGVPDDTKEFGPTGNKNSLPDERAKVTFWDCLLKDHKAGTTECLHEGSFGVNQPKIRTPPGCNRATRKVPGNQLSKIGGSDNIVVADHGVISSPALSAHPTPRVAKQFSLKTGKED